jgi:hypothetical protein
MTAIRHQQPLYTCLTVLTALIPACATPSPGRLDRDAALPSSRPALGEADAGGREENGEPDPSEPPADGAEGCSHDADSGLVRGLRLFWEDNAKFYSWDNLGTLALAVGLVAPLANTSADRQIRDWYQERVRTKQTDRVASVVEQAGDPLRSVPVLLGVGLTGLLTDDFDDSVPLTTWGQRSLRAFLVGEPPLGLLQIGLGGRRPGDGGSDWQPFRYSVGASGHSFVGAVPFLTAAAMTDNPYWHFPLVAASCVTGWARVNNDRHYFSQVVLGWTTAYLAVRCVAQTDASRDGLMLVPTLTPEGPGVGLLLQY